MSNRGPADATAAELTRRLASGEVGSVELLDHLLDRIGRIDPSLGAVCTLDADRARERARVADEATARGERWGPLHGLPMTIKDVWETDGLLTTCGDPALRHHVPARDATAVARLRAAGAVVFAKTNVPIQAGDNQTFNELFGTTANPWDTSRTPGGSSGGAAAALAAGLTPLELGSDIGGSIRMPASLCGVYGLKPSWGVVPLLGHIPGPPGSLVGTDVNCGGPMARSVDDLELALDVLAGPEDDDAVAWRLELPPASDLRAGPEGLRVSVCVDDDRYPVSVEVRDVVLALADRLEAAGARVERTPLPVPVREGARAWTHLVVAHSGEGLDDRTWEEFRDLAAGADPDDPVSDALRALVSSHRERRQWDQRRQEQRRAWARHFEDVDVVLAPAVQVPAFPHDHERPIPFRSMTYRTVDGERSFPHLDLTAWCGAVGAVLLPVVTLPAGFTPAGLPVGVQVVGPWLRDRATLAAARAVDSVGPGFVAPPVGRA